MKTQDLFAKANESWDSGDLRGAFKLFSVAAKNGDASSQNSLGFFYDHGLGVKKIMRVRLFGIDDLLGKEMFVPFQT